MAPGSASPKENGTSKKQAGKRKRESTEAPVAGSTSNASEGRRPTHLTEQAATNLLQVFELLDVTFLNANVHAAVGSSKAANAGHASLRAALETRPLVSIDTLRDLVDKLLVTLNKQNPPLPDLPEQSEGQPKKRTAAEEEELLIAQSERIETADRADAAREVRERWKAQVLQVLDQVESQLCDGHPPPERLATLPEPDVKRTRSSGKSKGKLPVKPLEPIQGVADPKQKVVLHRALLNSVDLFGSSGDLTMQELMQDPKLLAQLRQLEDTDVVGVQSIEGSTHLRQPASTLGQISLPPRPPPATKQDISKVPDPRPVLNLYFDPFSSFAPTYDSTNANLSYVSSAWWSSSQESAAAHQNQSLLARAYTEDIEASKANTKEDKPTDLESLDFSVDEALASHLGLGSKSDLDKLLEVVPPLGNSTDHMLQSISTSLLDLQLSQLDRLRVQASQLRVLPIAGMHLTNGEPATVQLSELESAQAVDVLEKLTKLAASVRPAELTPAADKQWLAKTLNAPLLDAQDDPASVAPTFAGTLPAQQATVLRESLLTRVGPSAKRSTK